MRELIVTPSNRHCVVEPCARPTPSALRRDILRRRGVQEGFSVLSAPAPAHDETLFKVAGNDRVVLVAVACFDSLRWMGGPERAGADSLEILVDLRHDRLGYVQFILTPDTGEKASDAPVNPHRDRALPSALTRLAFQPYPEAAGSGYEALALKRWEMREEAVSSYSISALRIRWFFAWFDARELFARGDRVGFNVARFRPVTHEFSSWNYCSGNGSPDATAFGTLYRRPPRLVLDGVKGVLAGGELALEGRVRGKTGRGLSLTVTAPDGAEETVKAEVRRGAWSVRVPVTMPIPGRYRLTPAGTGASEPDFTSLDLPDRAMREGFKVSLLFDTPMCMVANYYTPERLSSQMRLIRDLGIDRIHWQDYGTWPSFWRQKERPWAAFAARTFRECPDLRGETVKAAHRAGLEFIADLKVFDLGINCFFARKGPAGWGAARELENRYSSVIPEIEAHPEWTWQSHPAWRKPESDCIGRVRFYSLDPLPRFKAGDFRLLVSDDNRAFRPLAGSAVFRQGRVQRPHLRWTPAGLVPEKGTQENGFLEWVGLEVRARYLAIESAVPFRLRHRGFMAAEVEGADGREAAFTMATNGQPESGFFFWKGWQGWNNLDEALLQAREWDGRHLGLVFREADRMPTLLEPGYEGARSIWLERIRAALGSGADGVSIRTYCHHNGPMHYLAYAYAPPVLADFRARTGRDPGVGQEDETRVRRIRGAFYSLFIEAASRLARGAGKKFMVELESGIEIPDSSPSRMQLPMEWKRWIEEGWLDEIRLKYFTAENPFIHREVMPAARAHGIPVQLISRCLHQGVDLRTREMGGLIGSRAGQSGFSGYCLYEQQNLMDINSEGLTELKGPARTFVQALRSYY